MTTSTPPSGRQPRSIRWGDLLLAAIGLGAALVLFIGAANMEVRGQAVPGPQFFPVVVGVLLAVVGGFLLVRALIPARLVEDEAPIRPDVSQELLRDVSGANTQLINLKKSQRAKKQAAHDDEEHGDFDWRAVGIAAASVAGFILVLPLLGWIISSALLFAAVTLAFGSKRILFNLGVGLFIGSVVQLVFSGLLGLSLPAGFLGGIL